MAVALAIALNVILASAGYAPVPHPIDFRRLQELTPCQACCSPGGDCSAAFHQKPGICCGTAGGVSYCCPAAANGLPLAMCVQCNIGYKCATTGSVRTASDRSRICDDHGGAPGGSPGPYPQHRSAGGAEDAIGSLVALIFLGVLGFVIYRCCVAAQSQQAGQQLQYGQSPPPYGATYNQPPYPGGGYPAGGYPAGYPQQAGYGGGTVAAAGGAGFLGGMLVGEAMTDHGAGAGYGGGGYGGGGGGGYGGGGDGGGGGGGGGGDGGFSADS